MRKTMKKIHGKYKETFTRSNAQHEPEDHHIAGVILLLMFIIILLCGVIFILLEENDSNIELLQDIFIENLNDDLSYSYDLNEFSELTGVSNVNIDTVQQYLFDEGFEDMVVEEGTSVSGRKGVGCYEDVFKNGKICITYVVTYQNGDSSVKVGVERRLLEDQ